MTKIYDYFKLIWHILTIYYGLAFLFAVIWLGWISCAWEWLTEGTATNNDVVRTLILLLGGVVAVIFGFWRAFIANRQAIAAQKNVEATQATLLSTRFSTAIEHLKDEKLFVRLGGINTLGRLLEDGQWQNPQDIVDILCAFIRNPPYPTEATEENPNPPVDDDVQEAFNIIAHKDRPDEWKLSLTGAKLIRIYGVRAKLMNADLMNADLINADLRNADLMNADLRNANLRNANLRNADLRNADLMNADLRNAKLMNADLRKAKLLDADLRKAYLSDAKLLDADLRKAYLSDANLSEADLRDADLRKAKLLDADLSEANLWFANLRDAKLRNANLRNAKLMNADLRKAKLLDADLRKAYLSDANLSEADLRDADLRDAKLMNADLRNADLMNADLRDAKLMNADLRDAKLMNADLRKAYLSDANLSRAKLEGIKTIHDLSMAIYYENMPPINLSEAIKPPRALTETEYYAYLEKVRVFKGLT